jgi:hypothetical protein
MRGLAGQVREAGDLPRIAYSALSTQRNEAEESNQTNLLNNFSNVDEENLLAHWSNIALLLAEFTHPLPYLAGGFGCSESLTMK